MHHRLPPLPIFLRAFFDNIDLLISIIDTLLSLMMSFPL